LPNSGQVGRDPAGYDLIRPDQEVSGHYGWIQSNFLAGIRRRLPDVAGFRQHLPNSDFAFCNFFVQAKHRKIFFEKIIFLKIISSKLFYDGNHFTSKQTEHKTGELSLMVYEFPSEVKKICTNDSKILNEKLKPVNYFPQNYLMNWKTLEFYRLISHFLRCHHQWW
jgi:hypothetical protein